MIEISPDYSARRLFSAFLLIRSKEKKENNDRLNIASKISITNKLF